MSRPALLEAVGIARRAPTPARRPADAAWLLRNVSLRLHDGERLVLEGPSGSGKTLLLRALALLDPLDEGIVRWRGVPVADDAVPAFRRRIVYLHQRPALFEGSVESNLRRPFRLAAGGAYERPRVVSLLGALGRGEEFLSRATADLSGGEAQIAAFLRAIQLEPEALLLDEPTAALDEESASAIERLVTAWFEGRRGGRSLVWVSHDRVQAGRMGDRVVRLAAGRLAA